MIFLREIGGSFDKINEEQRRFVEFWYWASVFANRYSTSTNEVIIADSQALTQIAHGQRISARGYFRRLRSLVTEPADLYSYTRRASQTYRGVLNLLAFDARGLHDWRNTQRIGLRTSDLDDHHIFPRAYITSRPQLDIENDEAEQLMDSVVNRTLIPRGLNIRIGKRAPYDYLNELRTKQNARLAICLESHLMPADLLTEPLWSNMFGEFIKERARKIYALIERYAITPLKDMAKRHGSDEEIVDEKESIVGETVDLDNTPKTIVNDPLDDGDEIESSSDNDKDQSRKEQRKQCVSRLSQHFKVKLMKVNQTIYRSQDGSMMLFCAVSREYPDKKAKFWFTFNRSHLEQIKKSRSAFAAFGCGSADRIFLFSLKDLEEILLYLNLTMVDSREHWHFHIFYDNGQWKLIKKGRSNYMNISLYLV